MHPSSTSGLKHEQAVRLGQLTQQFCPSAPPMGKPGRFGIIPSPTFGMIGAPSALNSRPGASSLMISAGTCLGSSRKEGRRRKEGVGRSARNRRGRSKQFIYFMIHFPAWLSGKHVVSSSPGWGVILMLHRHPSGDCFAFSPPPGRLDEHHQPAIRSFSFGKTK